MASKLVLITAAGVLLCRGANAQLVTYRAHGPINQIVDFSYSSNSSMGALQFWTDVPNAGLRLIIPKGPGQLVMGRFTAAASCNSAMVSGNCFARIVAGKVEMLPNSTAENAFVSTGQPTFSAAIDRSLALPAGTYTIKVQVLATDPSIVMELADWHLNIATADYGVAPGTAPGRGHHRNP